MSTKRASTAQPGGPHADHRLAEICRERLAERYAGSAHRAESDARRDEELRVIRSLGLSGFFLVHRDMLEVAREVAAEVRGPDTVRTLLPPAWAVLERVLDRLLPHHASRTAQAEGAVKPRVGAVIEIGRVSNGQAFQPQSARAPPGRIRPGRRRE